MQTSSEATPGFETLLSLSTFLTYEPNAASFSSSIVISREFRMEITPVCGWSGASRGGGV